MSGFASAWWEWAARGLALSSLLMLAVGLLVLLAGRRLSARTAAWLSLLPLLPLAVPRIAEWSWPVAAEPHWVRLGTQTGILAPTEIPAVPAGGAPEQGAPHLAEGFVAGAVDDLRAPAGSSVDPRRDAAPEHARQAAAFGFREWSLLLWAAGAGLLLLGFVRNLRRTEMHLAQAQPLPAEEARRIHRLVPATRRLQLLHSPALRSPAAWGLRRRRIILPTGLAAEFDDPALAWVVRHELAHHQRRDLAAAGLQRLIQILWWFHPLLWIWQRRIELCRECACDELAARHPSVTPEHRRPAADALLAVAARPTPQPAPTLALHSLHHDTQQMKTRLIRLLQPRNSRLAGLTAGGLGLLLSATALALGQASPPAAAQEPRDRAEVIEEIVAEAEPVEEIVEEPILADLSANFDDLVTFRAQRWLIEHQGIDGAWRTGVETQVPAGEYTTMGTTALVLLALEQRHPQIPEKRWQGTLDFGLQRLQRCFDEERGIFHYGTPEQLGVRALPDHAIATYAACRLRAHARGEEWDRIRRQATATLVAAHNPYQGWRYGLQPDGDSDSLMTGLVLRALAEAQAAGVEVDPGVIQSALHYLSDLTQKESGRVGYQTAGSRDPRLLDKQDDYPVKYTELCTALGVLARAAHGADPLDDPVGLRSLTLLAGTPPVWNMTSGSVDYYYWMFGAQAMHQIGGRLAARWHHALREILEERQTEAGFWPAVDAWSAPDTTVHATACALLAWRAAQPPNQRGLAGGR